MKLSLRVNLLKELIVDMMFHILVVDGFMKLIFNKNRLFILVFIKKMNEKLVLKRHDHI